MLGGVESGTVSEKNNDNARCVECDELSKHLAFVLENKFQARIL